MSTSTTNPPPLPGRVGNLTAPQQAALDKLRQEIKDEGYYDAYRHDDACLLRFLRARKFDVPKAKLMLIEAEKWRKEFGVDEISNGFDFPEGPAVDKIYPQFYHKTDKDGRPVYIERLAKIDVKALYGITTQDRLLKRLVSEYERCTNERFPACSIVSGTPIETSCTILDLQGVGLGQFYKVKDYVSKASGIGQDRYPESMGKFYIINAPWGFSTVWNLIKGWLDEVTVAKIHILGSSYKSELTAQIPPENLPADLGGSCKCEGGCSLADQGPWQDDKIMAQVKEQNEEKRQKAAASSAAPPSTAAVEPIPAPASDVKEPLTGDAALQT